MKNPIVLIGTPSGSEWKADFGMSLVQLVAYTTAGFADGQSSIQFAIDNPKGSILSISRNIIVNRAMECGATHILFIDSDMTFPAQTLEMLLAHERPVVACNCVTKKIPATTTARLKSSSPAGKPLYTTPLTTDLTEVWRVGTGVMLIDMSVFSALKPPYFSIEWNEGIQNYMGEDWYFCQKLEEAGIPIHVDQHLSQAIGHVGIYRYMHDVVDVPAGIVDAKGKEIEG